MVGCSWLTVRWCAGHARSSASRNQEGVSFWFSRSRVGLLEVRWELNRLGRSRPPIGSIGARDGSAVCFMGVGMRDSSEYTLALSPLLMLLGPVSSLVRLMSRSCGGESDFCMVGVSGSNEGRGSS